MTRKGVAVLFGLVLMFVSLARPCSANNLEFAWGACPGQGGVHDVTFPCDDPTEPTTLYCVLDLTEPIPNLVDIDYRITLPDDTLMEYWGFQNTCGPEISIEEASCSGMGPALPGAQYSAVGASLSPWAVINGSIYVDANHPINLMPGRYVVYKLTFRNPSAIEAGGACVGCSQGVTFGPEIPIGSLGMRTETIMQALGASERHVIYQGCFTANGGSALCSVSEPMPANSSPGTAALVILLASLGVVQLVRSTRMGRKPA